MKYKELGMQILEIKPNDRVLIIAPHPDDECIGPGGLLCLYSEQCSVIVLSDGRLGQGDIDPEAGKAIRKREFVNEMQYLGISEYQMLDFKDGTLIHHTDCLENIDLSIYTKIFVTGAYDQHLDHTAAYFITCQAVHKQQLRKIEIYLYEVHRPLQSATHMLDITTVIDIKQHLISFHQSQLKVIPYNRYAECAAKYRALQYRMPDQYIEVYTLVPLDNKLDYNTVELEDRLQKSNLFYLVLTRWMELKIKGRSVAEILAEKGFYNIAVYGYAELGKLLCQELFGTNIKVAYILDKKVKWTGRDDLVVYVPHKGMPTVDAVVVTAVYYFDEIEESLLQEGVKIVISLQTLLESKLTEEEIP